jgi:hypothetical protein
MCMDKLSALLVTLILFGTDLRPRGIFGWDCQICTIDHEQKLEACEIARALCSPLVYVIILTCYRGMRFEYLRRLSKEANKLVIMTPLAWKIQCTSKVFVQFVKAVMISSLTKHYFDRISHSNLPVVQTGLANLRA